MNQALQTVWQKAMQLLSIREHSQWELKQKLGNLCENSELSSLLTQLVEENYQSDDRYAEVFIRSKVSKGEGRQRIAKELSMKGVSAEICKRALDEAEVDWYEAAKRVKEKKFGLPHPTDYKEKAKQTRFLQYRGFTFDEIRYALEARDDS